MEEKDYKREEYEDTYVARMQLRRQRIIRQKVLLGFRIALVFLIGFLCGNISGARRVRTAEPVEQEPAVISEKSAVTGPENPLKESPVTGVVVIDPGHGGDDPGSMVAPVWEKEINLQMALKLKTKLEENGVKVLLTRSDDETLSLAERAELANDNHADAFISIHQNSFDSSEVSGMEFYYNPFKEKGGEGSELLADILDRTIQSKSNMKSRGTITSDGLKVLRVSTVPAVLIECGYLTNPAEQKNLLSDAWQDEMTDYIAEGILDFLNENKNN